MWSLVSESSEGSLSIGRVCQQRGPSYVNGDTTATWDVYIMSNSVDISLTAVGGTMTEGLSPSCYYDVVLYQ